MYLPISNFIKPITTIVVILLLNACNSHKEGDGHDHGTESKPETEHHDEETPTRATLTREQIETVGIAFGHIEQKQLTATLRANGNLRVPNNYQANATSLFGGVIKSLNFQVGDYVKKGQVIATIENPQFIQLQEEYLTTGSRITFAEQEAQRQSELNEGGAGALKNKQNADAEIKSLRARKASLQKQLQLMGIDPNNISNNNFRSSLVVTSPINGTISNLFAKIGSYVDVSSPVAEIVDNTQLHLDLQVFEKDLPKLKVGQIIHFTLTNNPTTEYDAKVYSIGSSFENDSKTIAVHCTVTGNKSGLIDGMNITGLVSLDEVATPAVPNDAIVNADGKYYIFALKNGDEKARDQGGETANEVTFEKIEIIKGVSELGYTAITLIGTLPKDAGIVTTGAFFINAKLSNTGGHEH